MKHRKSFFYAFLLYLFLLLGGIKNETMHPDITYRA
nr:MAG TPA: hypothetical protein [Caudoviricetes sp.]